MSQESADGLPQFLSVPIENFYRYRGLWLLWRNLGHFDQNGSWVAPVSFVEAAQMPKEMLDVFFEMDSWLERLMKQQQGKK